MVIKSNLGKNKLKIYIWFDLICIYKYKICKPKASSIDSVQAIILVQITIITDAADLQPKCLKYK